MITIELSDELDNGWFTASWASAVEFEKWGLELGVANVEFLDKIALWFSSDALVEFSIGLFSNRSDWNKGKSLGWAGNNADTATHAVVWADGNLVLKSLEFFAVGLDGLASAFSFGIGKKEWTDDTVWAKDGAGVALDALVGIPLWNLDSDGTLLVFGSTGWESSIISNFVNSNVVTELSNGVLDDVVDTFLLFHLFWDSGEPSSLVILVFLETFKSLVDALLVLGDDISTLALVLFSNGFLEELDVLLGWENLGKVEEDGLHQHIDTAWHTEFSSDSSSINDVNLSIDGSKVLAEGSWEEGVEISAFWNVKNE